MNNKLIKKVSKMELGNPIITTLVGLVVFYIGLKMFSGGMKAMGNMDHLSFFIHNPYWMFLGGIVMTLLWQSCTCCVWSCTSTCCNCGCVRSKYWNNWNYMVSRCFSIRWYAERRYIAYSYGTYRC